MYDSQQKLLSFQHIFLEGEKGVMGWYRVGYKNFHIIVSVYKMKQNDKYYSLCLQDEAKW